MRRQLLLVLPTQGGGTLRQRALLERAMFIGKTALVTGSTTAIGLDVASARASQEAKSMLHRLGHPEAIAHGCSGCVPVSGRPEPVVQAMTPWSEAQR